MIGSGSNLLVADDGFHGLAIKLGRRAGDDRARRRAHPLRRRRPPALGGGEDRRLGTLGPRVRDQHPRHRRRRGADERQRLRRPAGPGARVGRGQHRRRDRAPRARAARLLLPALEPARGRGRRPRLLPADARRPGRDPGDPGERCASAAARPSPRGSRPSARPSRTPRTSAPRAARPGSCSRPPAAAACATAAPASPRSTPTSSRTTGDATTADVLELMAEGRRRVHERFGVELEPEVQVLGEVALARAAGSCEPRLVGGRRWSSWSRSSWPSTGSWLRDKTVDRARPGAGAGGDDRRRRRSGRRSPATARSSAGCRCPKNPPLPRLPLAEVPEGRPARRPGARTGARPRRRPGRPAPLRRPQLLRRERGRRRTSPRGSNCASATPRRPRESGRRRRRCSPIRR